MANALRNGGKGTECTITAATEMIAVVKTLRLPLSQPIMPAMHVK